MSIATGLAHRLPQQWQKRGVAAWLLLPLGLVYSALTGLRRLCYRFHLLHSQRMPVPVIVVGNVTVGGAGKTPLVIWLAERLRERGWQAGVISRGYGGNSSGVVAVGRDADATLVGDEPLLIARRTQCPVFIGRDRVAAARALLRGHPECKVLIADDGLQHYRLARDVELVVFDQRGAGNGFPLPAGPLREPVSRCARAQALIAHGAVPLHVVSEAAVPRIFTMHLGGTRLYRLARPQEQIDVAELPAHRVHAIAAIGHPERFFDQLRQLGLDVVPHAFPDHHAYVADELAFGADQVLLMTEKDAVKCSPFANRLPAQTWVLRVDAELAPDPLPYLIGLLEKAHGPATA